MSFTEWVFLRWIGMAFMWWKFHASPPCACLNSGDRVSFSPYQARYADRTRLQRSPKEGLVFEICPRYVCWKRDFCIMSMAAPGILIFESASPSATVGGEGALEWMGTLAPSSSLATWSTPTFFQVIDSSVPVCYGQVSLVSARREIQ